jgi:hypothetical protein
MASPDGPFPPVRFSVSSKPVVSLKADPLTEFESKDDAGSVCKKDIMENMVPPALSKVREYMLSRELEHFINHTPQMKERSISQDQCCHEPVDAVDQEVVIHVVKDVRVVYITVVIVRVVALRHRFAQSRMNVAKEFSCILCVLIKHKHKEVKID